ncbi:TPA: hypothetical protein ACJTOQ_002605 [Klebsiella pneumoniae]
MKIELTTDRLIINTNETNKKFIKCIKTCYGNTVTPLMNALGVRFGERDFYSYRNYLGGLKDEVFATAGIVHTDGTRSFMFFTETRLLCISRHWKPGERFSTKIASIKRIGDKIEAELPDFKEVEEQEFIIETEEERKSRIKREVLQMSVYELIKFVTEARLNQD